MSKLIRSQKNEGKKELPWELDKEIMRIQVDEDLTWEDACKRLAMICNKAELAKLVQSKAEELGKSRFLTSMNTARGTIERNADARATERVRQSETNFQVQCAKGCGKPMHFSERDQNYYTEVLPVLRQAFQRWAHETCPK
jgi:hypothetical protein